MVELWADAELKSAYAQIAAREFTDAGAAGNCSAGRRYLGRCGTQNMKGMDVYDIGD